MTAKGVNSTVAFWDKYVERVKQAIQPQVDRAVKNAYAQTFALAEKDITDIFNDSITRFYADYTPVKGGYHRMHSLYRLMFTERTENSLKIWFEPSAMTTFRNGYAGEDGLYDQVFRKGWHGGAASGDYTFRGYSFNKSGWVVTHTQHPDPGTPYWRTPIPYYSQWGRKAKISDPSPLQDIKNKAAEYSVTSQQIFNGLLEQQLQNIRL